ncbi:MAG: MscL family protein [Gemmatimonadales bacterium]
MLKDFREYLIKQNAIGLALAVVIGAALNKVVQALVNDIIMPVVSQITPSKESWETMKLPIGPVNFLLGDLLSSLLNFVIIAFVVWRISKIVMPAPAAATKVCPYCKKEIDLAATRCSHCTSQLA